MSSPPVRTPRAWQIWHLAFNLERRLWLILGIGALTMGAASQAVELLPLANGVGDLVAIVVSTYFYFLFLAFLEVIVDEDERGASLSARRCLALTTGVLDSAFAIAVVGTLVLSIGDLLIGLFILPGVWFLTRTGLTVPAMVLEDRGPRAALRRSFELTSHRFRLALLTVGLALIVEEVVDAEVAVLVRSPFHGGDWGTWVLGGVILTAAVFVTAPVVSMTFQRLHGRGASAQP